MKIEKVLICCENIFKKNGFENVFIKEFEYDIANNVKVVIANSSFENDKRVFPIIYSLHCIGQDENESLKIFRINIEIQGLYNTKNFNKLCEYASLITPYLLVGTVYVTKEKESVDVNLIYDAILDTNFDNEQIEHIFNLAISAMSCCIIVISKRICEVEIGNFKVLEDKSLLEDDIKKLNDLMNFNN